jgi:hypothetical protein
MVSDTVFAFANSPNQSLAIVIGTVFTVGFFVWVAYLAWK